MYGERRTAEGLGQQFNSLVLVGRISLRTENSHDVPVFHNSQKVWFLSRVAVLTNLQCSTCVDCQVVLYVYVSRKCDGRVLPVQRRVSPLETSWNTRFILALFIILYTCTNTSFDWYGSNQDSNHDMVTTATLLHSDCTLTLRRVRSCTGTVQLVYSVCIEQLHPFNSLIYSNFARAKHAFA